jgi:hypothetical protein
MFSGTHKEETRLLCWDKLVFDADIALGCRLGQGPVGLYIIRLLLMVFIKQHRTWPRTICADIVD